MSSRYSQTSVTIRPKAAYHSTYFGAPTPAACSMKSVRCANYVRTLRRDLLKLAEATGVEHPGLIGSTAVEPLMDVEQVGRTVAYLAGLPLDVNVLFMTIMATKMPFVGRG